MSKRFIWLLLPLFALAIYSRANDETKDEDRLKDSGIVLREILNVPDGIPHDLLQKADCVIVFPSVRKAAFGVGGSYSRGAMTCRQGENFKGRWGAPTMMALEGASFGFQIGAQATDVVLLVMNDHGANSILGDRVKLGADASAAAGPKGRDASAETDVARAEILSYSRARGVFAGVSLEGSTVRPDRNANKAIYGKDTPARKLIQRGFSPQRARVRLLTLGLPVLTFVFVLGSIRREFVLIALLSLFMMFTTSWLVNL